MNTLEQLTFTLEDQLRFAALSGDANPMHVNPVAARRVLTGLPVVHGMHLLLRSLEGWARAGGTAPTGIDCQFALPVNVGDVVSVSTRAQSRAGALLEVRVSGQLRTRALLACDGDMRSDVASPSTGVPERMDVPAAPLDHPVDYWTGRFCELDCSSLNPAGAFPALTQSIGSNATAALAMVSTVVGMLCPGLHSILSAVRVTLGASSDNSHLLRFELVRYDPRVSLAILRLTGPIRGEVRAFVRPHPRPQARMIDLARLVPSSLYSGKTVWVLGGSRGLGEVSAKVAAAGGADVTITYAMGEADAEAVATEINAAGRGRCDIRRYSLGETSMRELMAASQRPDAVCFFATPRIFRKGAGWFDEALYADFTRAYVTEFARICTELQQLPGDAGIRVLLPSTVAVTDRPKGMTEYAMAKAAAEILGEDLSRSLSRVRVHSVRLPRLETDQTASIIAVETERAEDFLEPLIRSLLLGR